MNNRIVDDEIVLVPYYPCEEITLKWYQDAELCKQVDNIDGVYTLDRLRAMYDFLSSHGDCYYIKYRGKLVGDVSLRDNCEVSIVVCREYQNKHIGRRCILNIIELAKENGIREITAVIYSFNEQSRRMFESVGFKQTGDEQYIYRIVQ